MKNCLINQKITKWSSDCNLFPRNILKNIAKIRYKLINLFFDLFMHLDWIKNRHQSFISFSVTNSVTKFKWKTCVKFQTIIIIESCLMNGVRDFLCSIAFVEFFDCLLQVRLLTTLCSPTLDVIFCFIFQSDFFLQQNIIVFLCFH